MSTSLNDWGPALMAYLHEQWEARGTTRAQFGKLVPFADSNFTNWAKGVEPKLDPIRQIADALGVSPVEVLHGMGFLTDTERDRLVQVEFSHDVGKAIESDPGLTKTARNALRAVFTAVQHDGDVHVIQDPFGTGK